MPGTKGQKRGQGRLKNRAPLDWEHATDEALLDWRLCDLGVKIRGTMLEGRVAQLYGELQARGLTFRPHCWLSDEWFTPDGVPGIAIPFYLAHPRLEKLERKMMLEVEGGSHVSCMRILRHEAGHAIDNAYRLYRKKRWQAVFGLTSTPYPEFYRPRPNSKSFVQHLDMWYAQAHPAEDFAETFAVWLKPRSPWRQHYREWPALKKLELVDQLMHELKTTPPVVVTRQKVDPLHRLKKTLRQHYAEKMERYGLADASVLDQDLQRLFTGERRFQQNPSATGFLRRYRRELRQAIGYWTGQHQYTIDQVLNEIINRCRELKLRLRWSERETRRHLLIVLTAHTMNYLHARRHMVVL